MLFDFAGTKEDQINRIIDQRGCAEELELDFGNPNIVNPKIIIPNFQIDTGGDEDLLYDELSQEEIDECYDFEELKSSRRSQESEKFYKNTLTMFSDVTNDGADSPLQQYYNEIIGDVHKFVQALGVKPHWQQEQLLDAYQNGETNIAVRSGQGPGKTFCSCVIWLHWLLANPYGLLVITAPTMRQCKDVWLAQARQLIQEADPRLKAAYEFTNTGIKMFGHKAADWGAYLATANKAENFQGIHRERLGIHCEEASGLDRGIIETIQGTLSGAEGTYLWLQIGNPNSRDCAFYDSFYGNSSIWYCIHWNGEETPETPFFSRRRNAEVEEEHGRDSDIYRVRVLGEFPSLDPNSIISLEELKACCTPEALLNATRINASLRAKGKQRRHLGLDLARFGGDENTIVPFESNIQKGKIEAYSRIDPNDALDRAIKMQEELEWETEHTLYIVDTSGMGEGVVGSLGQKKRLGKRVHEYYTQNCANESSKYANKATEAWMLFAKAVRKKEIYLLYDKKTFDQLSKRRYGIDKRGRILIESKDDYKKRQKGGDTGDLGKSPDRADCITMGYYPVAEVSSRIAAFE
jgi:hypothetical protein